jgi:hypothetical protein
MKTWAEFQRNIAVVGYDTGQMTEAKRVQRNRGGRAARKRKQRDLQKREATVAKRRVVVVRIIIIMIMMMMMDGVRDIHKSGTRGFLTGTFSILFVLLPLLLSLALCRHLAVLPFPNYELP